ncbi:MAG: hypothetical protein ABIH38_01925 [Patescibacteria group bacterium]
MAIEDVKWAIWMAAAMARGKEYNGKFHPPWQVTPRHMQLGCDYDFAALLSAQGYKELKAFKARVAKIKERHVRERLTESGK